MTKTEMPPLPNPAEMLATLTPDGVEEVPHYTAGQMIAYAMQERQRWRNKAMAHRDMTVMSKFATLRECEAARNAIQSLLADGA